MQLDCSTDAHKHAYKRQTNKPFHQFINCVLTSRPHHLINSCIACWYIEQMFTAHTSQLSSVECVI